MKHNLATTDEMLSKKLKQMVVNMQKLSSPIDLSFMMPHKNFLFLTNEIMSQMNEIGMSTISSSNVEMWNVKNNNKTLVIYIMIEMCVLHSSSSKKNSDHTVSLCTCAK